MKREKEREEGSVCERERERRREGRRESRFTSGGRID